MSYYGRLKCLGYKSLSAAEGKHFGYFGNNKLCAAHRDFLQKHTIRLWGLPSYWDKSEAVDYSWSVKTSYNSMQNLKVNSIGETSFWLSPEMQLPLKFDFPWNSKIHLMGKKLIILCTTEAEQQKHTVCFGSCSYTANTAYFSRGKSLLKSQPELSWRLLKTGTETLGLIGECVGGNEEAFWFCWVFGLLFFSSTNAQ